MNESCLFAVSCCIAFVPPPTVTDQEIAEKQEYIEKHGTPPPIPRHEGLFVGTLPKVPEYADLSKKWNRGPWCGPNSLYVLLQLSGKTVSHDDVLASVPVQKDGCSVEDLLAAASKFGLQCEMRELVPDELRNLQPPFIVHTVRSESVAESGHFSVVLEYEDARDAFLLADGTSGVHYYIDAGVLFRRFSGFVIIPTSNVDIEGLLQKAFWISAAIAGITFASALMRRGSR